MKSFRMIAYAIALGAMILAPTACKKEGEAEKAGKQLDKKADEAKDKIGDIMDKAEEKVDAAVENAAEKVDEAVK